MSSHKVIFIIIGLMLNCGSAWSQLGSRAWSDFNVSLYETIEDDGEDVNILFDRKYIDVMDEANRQVLQFTTVHRKIKVNTLFGLKKFNTLYLPTYEDVNYTISIVSCKVQVLKKDGSKIETPYTDAVETSLPANVPFYYKMDGRVQMIAIQGLSIGDEVEYVYKLRRVFNSKRQYFYLPQWTSFSSDFPCREKTLFVDAKKFEVSIYPHNFLKNGLKAEDFIFDTGYKITLNNLKGDTGNPYANSNLDEPSASYIVSGYSVDESTTWEHIAKDFKANRQETRKSTIFDGTTLYEAQRKINALPTTKEKMTMLLDKINGSLESSAFVFYQVKDDIDIAWSYARQVSKMMNTMYMPVDFHLVVDKNIGKLDKLNQSIYQFDNIIMSVLDENGDRIYLSLLEPYSEINEIRPAFQNTECFTISQNRNGARTHSFGVIPDLKRDNFIKRTVKLNAQDETSQVGVLVTEELEYAGDAWMEVRPDFSFVLADSSDTDERLERFVIHQIIDHEKVDSLNDISYEYSADIFKITYTYNYPEEIFSNGSVSKLKLQSFFNTWRYLPRQRDKTNFGHGYLFDEPTVKLSLAVDKLSNRTWLENENLNRIFNNNVGDLKSNYTANKGALQLDIELQYNAETIDDDQWNDLFDLNEQFNAIMNANLYFKTN